MVGNDLLLAVVRLEMGVVTLVIGGVVGVEARFAVVTTWLVAMVGLSATAFGGEIDCWRAGTARGIGRVG